MTTLVADAAIEGGYRCDIFQNDRQTRLNPYGTVTQVPVASSNQTMASSTQDTDNHEDFLQHFKRNLADPHCVTIYDTAAGSIGRIPDILQTLRIDGRLVKAGRSALVGIPVSTRVDICEAALKCLDLASAALPNQYIVPFVSFRDGNPDELPRDHPFWQVIKKARHGAVILPVIVLNVGLALEQAQYRLSELGDPDTQITEEQLSAEMGILETRANMLMSACRDMVLHMGRELEPLGFFGQAGS